MSDLRNAKAAREAADYGLTYGKNAAEGTVKDADSIWEIVSRYLAGKGFAIPQPVIATAGDPRAGPTPKKRLPAAAA